MEKGINMHKEILDEFYKEFDFPISKLNEVPPLVLAYIGDAIFEVYIRTFLIGKNIQRVHELHVMSTSYVKAKAQSEILHKIMDMLTPDELSVVKRGRNAKSGTIPKNANVTEYKYATGFEALIGYLYLAKKNNRLFEILKYSVN